MTAVAALNSIPGECRYMLYPGCTVSRSEWSDSSDRIGDSKYRKMYKDSRTAVGQQSDSSRTTVEMVWEKAVMRNYGPLPWDRLILSTAVWSDAMGAAVNF